MRVAALVWLVGALGGCLLGLAAVAKRRQLYLALTSVTLGLPNIVFAGLFCLAALMGDVTAPSVPLL